MPQQAAARVWADGAAAASIGSAGLSPLHHGASRLDPSCLRLRHVLSSPPFRPATAGLLRRGDRRRRRRETALCRGAGRFPGPARPGPSDVDYFNIIVVEITDVLKIKTFRGLSVDQRSGFCRACGLHCLSRRRETNRPAGSLVRLQQL